MSAYNGGKMGDDINSDYEKENYIITIEEAKGRSTKSRATVLGVVTCISKKIFIQDNTSGICLIKSENKFKLKLGDVIYVTGNISKDHGLICISRYTAKIVVNSSKLPAPKIIKLQDIEGYDKKLFQGFLVKIQNIQIRIKKSGKRVYVYDSYGNKLVIQNLSSNTKISDGDNVDIIGILSYDERFELWVRGDEDIAKSKEMKINIVKPINMVFTFNRKPHINAVFLCGDEAFNSKNAVMYLDGDKVASIKNESEIKYTPKDKLKYGEHRIFVEAIDGYGEVKQSNSYFVVQERDAKYNLYFGVPHTHTSYSDGIGTPYEAFNHAKKLGLDYLIVSDHLSKLGNSNQNDRNVWKDTIKQVENMNKKNNDFLAIVGYERSSRYWGHINIINAKECDCTRPKSINEWKEWLLNMKNISAVINHPDSHFKVNDYVDGIDNVINSIEVGNGAYPNKYMRKEKYFFRALDNQWYLGAVNGQDNHVDNWGDSDNLTVVLAEKLNLDSFMKAFKQRRTYSTESRTLKLKFKINDFPMGSIIAIEKNEKIKVNINAQDIKMPIKKIQIISNESKIIFERDYKVENKVKIDIELEPLFKRQWYVVKVIHENNRWGISSPIFVVNNGE